MSKFHPGIGCLLVLCVWVAAILVPVCGFNMDMEHEIPRAVVSAILMFAIIILGPAIGILTGFELLRYLQQKNSQTFLARSSRVALGTPLGCFGVLGVVTGVLLVGGALWLLVANHDITEMVRTRALVPMGLAAIGFGWWMFKVAIGRSNLPTESDEQPPKEEL